LLLAYPLGKEAHKPDLIGVNIALVVELEVDIRHGKLPNIVTKVVCFQMALEKCKDVFQAHVNFCIRTLKLIRAWTL